MGATAPSRAEKTVTRELATANIAMGVAGLLALVPGWAVTAGLAGGIFLFSAWAGHVGNTGKNAQEQFATWTDFLVGIVVIALAVYTAIRFLTGTL